MYMYEPVYVHNYYTHTLTHTGASVCVGDWVQVRHIPTDEVMLNKRMTGFRKIKDVELLKKLYHPNILQ